MTISCASLIGCNKLDTGKEWKVVSYDDGFGQTFDQRVCFDVSRNSKKIDYVWVKVSAIDNRVESVNIVLQRYSTDDTDAGTTQIKPTGTAVTHTVTQKQVKDAKKNTNGWIKLNATAWGHNSSYVLFSCKGNITLDEVVFVSEDNKRLNSEIDYAEIVYENNEGKKLSKVFTQSELNEIKDAKYGLPTNLLNDQESFDNRNKK